MTAKQVQIGDRPCRIYGADCAEYLLLQMTDEHELQRMDNEVAAIAQGAAHPFLFAAIPVESWNDALSPWEAPAVWGKQGFGGNAEDTLRFLTEQVVPTLKRQFYLPENIKIILGGYSLAGLFALWASTQTDLFYGVAAASPSVWFPDWMEFEQQRPIQTQHIYLSLAKPQAPDLVSLLNAYYTQRRAGAYSQKGKISNLKEMNETFNYLRANGIYSLEIWKAVSANTVLPQRA